MIKKGYKLNYLEVISDKIKRENRQTYFLCQCECGKIRYVNYNNLLQKNINDCGCNNFKLDKLRKEWIGKKINMLTIIDLFRGEKENGYRTKVLCQCECGKKNYYPFSIIKRGSYISCGCYQDFNFERDYQGKKYHNIEILELINKDTKMVKCKCHCGQIFQTKLINITKKKRYVIGCPKCNDGKNLLYNIKKSEEEVNGNLRHLFSSIKQRCYNQNNEAYKNYGGRGIKVCDEWLNDTTKFISWSLDNGYEKGLEIDRIDVNGNYEPSNCRWVSRIINANNKRNNIKYIFNNKEMSIKEISELVKIPITTLKSRLKKGMSIDEAIIIPKRKNQYC